MNGSRHIGPYAVGAFGLGISSMTNFIVPLRAHELGASLTLVGLIIAAGALSPALLSVSLGALIDKLGPRRAFVLGALATAVIISLYAAATAPLVLLALQLAIGAVRSTGWIAAQSYIAGVGRTQDRARHTGRFSVATNLGKLGGPLLIGAAADLFGFQRAFLVIAAVALGFAVMGMRLPRLAEEQRATSRRRGAGFADARTLFALPGIRVALLLTLARLMVATVWASFLPLVLSELGVPTTVIGTVLAAAAAVATATALAADRLTRHRSPELVAAAVLAGGAAGLILAPLVAWIPAVYVPAVFIGLASGVSLPLLITILSDAAPDGARGVALGLRMSANQSARVVAPAIVGPVMAALGSAVAFGVIGGSALLLLVPTVALIRRNARSGDVTA